MDFRIKTQNPNPNASAGKSWVFSTLAPRVSLYLFSTSSSEEESTLFASHFAMFTPSPPFYQVTSKHAKWVHSYTSNRGTDSFQGMHQIIGRFIWNLPFVCAPKSTKSSDTLRSTTKPSEGQNRGSHQGLLSMVVLPLAALLFPKYTK